MQQAIRSAQHESRLREIGREVIRTRGANNAYIDGDIAEMARDSARQFARKDVAPLAERIHRHDEMVPESIIGSDARPRLLRHVRVPRSTAGGAWATSR